MRKLLTTCLILLLSLLGSSVLGQGVTAVRDGTTITVTNNTGHNIVLFTADMRGRHARINNNEFDGVEVRGAQIDIPNPSHNHYTIILNGNSANFEQRNRNVNTVIYYIDERPLRNPIEITISAIETIAAVAPTVQPTEQNQPQPQLEVQQANEREQQPAPVEERTTRVAEEPSERVSQLHEAPPAGTTSATQGRDQRSTTGSPTATNRTEIDNFRRQINALQAECAQLLRNVSSLSEAEREFLENRQRRRADLHRRINDFRRTLTVAAEINEVEELIRQLRELQEQIVIRLSDLSEEEIELIKERFRKAVSHAELLESLAIVSNRIDRLNWYNWWGRKSILANLDGIKNKIGRIYENEYRIFISNPDYQSIVSILESDFESIKDREQRHRNAFNRTDFRSLIVKFSIFCTIFLIVIAIVVIFVYMKHHNQKMEKEKKKREEERIATLGKTTFKKIEKTDTEQSEDNEIIATENSKIKQLLKKYEHGLSDVKANVNRIYREIDMFDFVEDSSIHKIYISRDFVKDLHKFFNDFLISDGKIMEAGCYVVGRWDYAPNTDEQAYDISLEHIVKPGNDARYSEFECEFGLEIGTSLIMDNRKYSEQSNAEYVHTSWVHSHPGLQLFLSKQDLIVQSTLTNNSPYKRMLAMVIDTKTEGLEMAFFSPKASEEHSMNNDKDLKKTITLDELLKWAETP